MYFTFLKMAMEMHGLRAYQLAELVKISPQSFSLKMHGRLPFTPIEKKRISECFGLSEDNLFEGTYFRHMAWLSGKGSRPVDGEVENAMLKPDVEIR